jgi:hypothetical protein
MRVVELSDHPGTLLRQAQEARTANAEQDRLRFEAALAEHRERVNVARQARSRALSQRRWWAWLQGFLVVWRERRRVPAAPVSSRMPSDQEGILAAGMEGERLVAMSLGRSLGEEWTLLRGYRNQRGEIDHLLLGPSGLFAIEVKHRNATVYCVGDRWWYIKYDRYGNQVDQNDMTDKRGRSPSQQLNEPADQIEGFLRSRGHPVALERIVLLTHSRSRLGNCTDPTVRVSTSTDDVIKLINASRPVITDDEREQLERLIIRDHQYHATRRTPTQNRARNARNPARPRGRN